MKKFWLLLSLVFFSGFAAAQNFPSRTVRLVSGVTPGAASDTMARVLAEKLSAAGTTVDTGDVNVGERRVDAPISGLRKKLVRSAGRSWEATAMFLHTGPAGRET